MKTIRLMLIVMLLVSVSMIVYLSERHEFTGLEVGFLIVIGVLAIFGTIGVHSIITLESTTRKREKYASKEVRL